MKLSDRKWKLPVWASPELDLYPFIFAKQQNKPDQNIFPSFSEWLKIVSPRWTWDWKYQLYIDSVLQDVTDGKIKKLMMFWPPRHGKSEKVTVRYSAYRIEKDPSFRVIIGAYNQTLASKFSRKARRIVSSRLGLEINAVDNWETPQEGGVLAVGVGSGATGHGANLIHIDDPVKNRQEAESPTYRERVWDWYREDITTRLEPGGAIILTMTRWHEDDLAGRILSSEDAPNWVVIKLPAEAEVNDILGREVGEPLCPERYGTEALEERKRVLGSYGYNALFQQRPAPIEGNIIKKEWIRYWDVLPAHFDVFIQSWDMAFKDGEKNSFVVGQVWGKSGNDCYLIEQRRGHWNFTETQSEVKKLSKQYSQAWTKLVEDKANGPAIINSLNSEVGGLVPVSVSGSKEARLQAVSPMFESANVFLPRAHWIDAYISELCDFPNAANDDQVDATSQALERLNGGVNAAGATATVPDSWGAYGADRNSIWG